MKKIPILLLITALLLFSLSAAQIANDITYYSYEVINTYPHDIDAFTQGLIFEEGYLYESTGRWGHSSLRRVKLESGEVEKIHHLDDEYFGEGLTIFDNKFYQLTWKAGVGFIYDRNFNLINKFHYDTEGWGLTTDGKFLIMSDGSSNLYFLDPETMTVRKKLPVTLHGEPLDNINELQYIDGQIFANVWLQDYIIIINPDSGKITGIINLEGIINPDNYDHQLDVLNGIAYDSKDNRLFITGKLWPYIFEIKLSP